MSHDPVIVMDELFQSCSIRNNSLFTKTTKTETRRSKMGPHMSGEKEREKLEGNLALIFFLFSEANIYPEDLKRKPILDNYGNRYWYLERIKIEFLVKSLARNCRFYLTF